MFVDQTLLSILFKQCPKLVASAGERRDVESGPVRPFSHSLRCGDACQASVRVGRVSRYDYLVVQAGKTVCTARCRGHTGGGATYGNWRDDDCSSFRGPLAPIWRLLVLWGHRRRCARPRPTPTSQCHTYLCIFHRRGQVRGAFPLSGLHLVKALTSSKVTRPREPIPPQEVAQFSRWCTPTNKRLKSNNPLSPTVVL